MSSLYLSSFAGAAPYEILLSYVHREASDEAMALREALQVAGYRVFLDVECIRGGSDWQDVLNDAVSNCSVFVPLITQQYGQVETHLLCIYTFDWKFSFTLDTSIQAHTHACYLLLYI